MSTNITEELNTLHIKSQVVHLFVFVFARCLFVVPEGRDVWGFIQRELDCLGSKHVTLIWILSGRIISPDVGN